MRQDNATPFDTIESAHNFVQLLYMTLADTKNELSADIQREPDGPPNRRRDALLVAAYNLERLEYHLTRSGRLLNDLRSIRRLLFEERAKTMPVAAPSNQKKTAHTATVPKNGRPVAAA